MSTATISPYPTFEVEQSFLSLFVRVSVHPLYFRVSSRSKSGGTIVLNGFWAIVESLLETHTLRVNEAAYKKHTTLKSSRETDALKTILKMLSVLSLKETKVEERKLQYK